MSLKCLFRGHEWILLENQCIEKCSICGKQRSIEHKWNGCKCERCDATRDEGHKYVNVGDNGINRCCERCGKKTTVYIVSTLSMDSRGAVTQLWDYFRDKHKNDVSFQQIQDLWYDKSGVKSKFADLVDEDVVNAPIRWLVAETGDTADTIQTLSGIRFFMIKGTFEHLTPYRVFNVEYTFCYYFFQP